MTGLLDEPRIAYASRKVQRFREDVEAWNCALPHLRSKRRGKT